MDTIRITFDIPSDSTVEQTVVDLFNESTLRKMASSWSFSKRSRSYHPVLRPGAYPPINEEVD